jgi:DNA-binding response OmpR family regulator
MDRNDLPLTLPQRSVLCVQPRIENQQFLQHALEGYRLEMVRSAFDAIRCSNHSLFDAYIVDYWLSDWAGTGVCREIRKHDPHVPIIFYTSLGGDHAARALRAGATVYIRAPIDAAVFRERVRLLIESADIHDLHARLEEQRTIHDELQRRAAAAIGNAEQAAWRASAAIERSTKLKAAQAFISAGGTRSGFQRFWPEFGTVSARERLS